MNKSQKEMRDIQSKNSNLPVSELQKKLEKVSRKNLKIMLGAMLALAILIYLLSLY